MAPKEQPIAFDQGRLHGVLTLPDCNGDKPAIVILNAGLIYRVGPGRLSVEAARRFARLGHATLRFDLSGLGESMAAAASQSAIEAALVDTRLALDALRETLGVQRFMLFGLCSGAVLAHHIAVADPRVVAAVMLDGYVLSTLRSRCYDAAERIRPLTRLPRRGLGWLQRRFAGAAQPALAVGDEAFIPPWPSKACVVHDLTQLQARGVALLMLYSGEWRRYRYQGQMAEALGGLRYGSLLTEGSVPTAEHLYFCREDRERMLSQVSAWLESQAQR